jgi:hypothetical protein
LALVLLVMETIHESERTSLLTPYNVANNVANSVALAAGSLLATLILNGLGLNATSYTCLFAASTLFRGLMLVLLRRVPAPPPDCRLLTIIVSPRIGGRCGRKKSTATVFEFRIKSVRRQSHEWWDST